MNTTNNNASVFGVNYFNERRFYLIFLNMLRSKRGLYWRRLEIYRKVPHVKLILQVREVFLETLVSLTAIISNDLCVHFSR